MDRNLFNVDNIDRFIDEQIKKRKTKKYIITVEEGVRIDPKLYENVIEAERLIRCKDCRFYNKSTTEPFYISKAKQFDRGAVGCYRASYKCDGVYDIDTDMDDPEGFCSKWEER